jgi:hypothetical protein
LVSRFEHPKLFGNRADNTGYESGQISGFLAMTNFIETFGKSGSFSAVRQGTIVGLLA